MARSLPIWIFNALEGSCPNRSSSLTSLPAAKIKVSTSRFSHMSRVCLILGERFDEGVFNIPTNFDTNAARIFLDQELPLPVETPLGASTVGDKCDSSPWMSRLCPASSGPVATSHILLISGEPPFANQRVKNSQTKIRDHQFYYLVVIGVFTHH